MLSWVINEHKDIKERLHEDNVELSKKMDGYARPEKSAEPESSGIRFMNRLVGFGISHDDRVAILDMIDKKSMEDIIELENGKILSSIDKYIIMSSHRNTIIRREETFDGGKIVMDFDSVGGDSRYNLIREISDEYYEHFADRYFTDFDKHVFSSQAMLIIRGTNIWTCLNDPQSIRNWRVNERINRKNED